MKSKSKSSCAMLKYNNKDRQFVNVQSRKGHYPHKKIQNTGWQSQGGTVSSPEQQSPKPPWQGGVRINQKRSLQKKFKIEQRLGEGMNEWVDDQVCSNSTRISPTRTCRTQSHIRSTTSTHPTPTSPSKSTWSTSSPSRRSNPR